MFLIPPKVLLDDIKEELLYPKTRRSALLFPPLIYPVLATEISVHSIALSNRPERFVSEILPKRDICLTHNLYVLVGIGESDSDGGMTA